MPHGKLRVLGRSWHSCCVQPAGVVIIRCSRDRYIQEGDHRARVTLVTLGRQDSIHFADKLCCWVVSKHHPRIELGPLAGFLEMSGHTRCGCSGGRLCSSIYNFPGKVEPHSPLTKSKAGPLASSRRENRQGKLSREVTGHLESQVQDQAWLEMLERARRDRNKSFEEILLQKRVERGVVFGRGQSFKIRVFWTGQSAGCLLETSCEKES